MITGNVLIYIGVVYLAVVIGTIMKFKIKEAPINFSTICLAIKLPFAFMFIITNDVIYNSKGSFFAKFKKILSRHIFLIKIFPIIVGVLGIQIKKYAETKAIRRVKTTDIRGVYEDNRLRGFELVN